MISLTFLFVNILFLFGLYIVFKFGAQKLGYCIKINDLNPHAEENIYICVCGLQATYFSDGCDLNTSCKMNNPNKSYNL
jgi:hypothetical protein